MVTKQKPINAVLKQALVTFSKFSDSETFTANLNVLKMLLDTMTLDDVGLSKKFRNDAYWTTKRKAPMSYIRVFENQDVSIGIFVMKGNFKLPLHNHPLMFGMLKVLMGTVKIESYSLNTEQTIKHHHLIEDTHNRGLFYKTVIAERNPDVVMNDTSQAQLLEPNSRNLHEIESIDGPAAFLDILSPPYDIDYSDKRDARNCSYYKIVNQLDDRVFQLDEIEPPEWFWSDKAQYKGPTLAV